MRCRDARPELSAFLDGELDPLVAVRVADHLDACAACASEHLRLERARNALRFEPLDQVVDLEARVLRALQPDGVVELDHVDPISTRRSAWRYVATAVGIAAAFAALISLGVLIDRSQETPPGPAGLVETSGMVLRAVWTSGGLAPDASARLDELEGTDEPVEVRGETLELTAPERTGWVVPIDALAVDPQEYSRVVDTATADPIRALTPNGVILSIEASAQRSAAPNAAIGTELRFGDATVVVEALLPARAMHGAELLTTFATPLPIDTPRFVLVEVASGDVAAFDAAAARVLGAPARLLGLGSDTRLRHGGAVLTLSEVKSRFGEFAYRAADRNRIEVDAEWERANIVEATIPGIGTVRCHRAIIEPLREAVDEIVRADASALDPGSFGGCFVPRRIDRDLGISRHAWGISVAIEVADNPKGGPNALPSIVIDAMENAGFTWGGTWLRPAPAYFEYTGR